MAQAAAKEPCAFKWQVGAWTPEMRDEGLALWTIDLGLDQVFGERGHEPLYVLSYREDQPVERRDHFMSTWNDDMTWWRGPIIRVCFSEERLPAAIEAALGYARGWILQERARQ